MDLKKVYLEDLETMDELGKKSINEKLKYLYSF